MKQTLLYICAIFAGTQYAVAQNADNDSLSWGDQQLDEVQVTSRKVNIKRLSGAQMGFEMGKDELFRAAWPQSRRIFPE